MLKKDITFVIPVRHPETLRNPDAQIRILSGCFSSVAAQSEDNWRAVVVANEGTPLPDLPNGFEVVWVAYEPNPQHDLNRHDFEAAMQWFRLDKGRRVWSGMKSFPDTKYFMILDDDDFVSRRITSFVRANCDRNGWFINMGYGMDPGGSWAFELHRFHKICGSSHIVRADLYDLPDADDPSFADYVRKWLGSHGATTEHFADRDAPLVPLPFHGAVYLVNNPNSHSRSNKMIRQYLLNKDTLRRPWSLPEKLQRLTLVNAAFRTEFLGLGRVFSGV